jgi:hypothetical protein
VDSAVKELPPIAFPWEGKPPLFTAYGFCLCSANLKIYFTYAVYKEGVLLACTERIGDNEPSLWRRHWTSIEAAVEAAEVLVGDAEDYIEMYRLPVRPYEDLDGDDFIQHLHMRLNNELH